MGFFIFFGLVYVGYSILDWGHYVVKHEKVSLWWLMSSFGSRDGFNATGSGLAGIGKDAGAALQPASGVGALGQIAGQYAAPQNPTQANNPLGR